MKISSVCFALCLAIPVFSAFAEPDKGMNPVVGREVVLSEFPILPAPGPKGTWVELYNRSPKEADLGKASLVCNGTRIAVFPTSFPIPGRSLVLIRFVSPHSKPWDCTDIGSNTQLVQLPALVAEYTGKHRVRPGFLALEVAFPNGRDRVGDYVRWGRFSLGSDEKYNARAAQAGAYPQFESKPLYVGISQIDEEIPYPKGDMLLKRITFDPKFDRSEAWALLDLEEASPGKPNVSLPAPHLLLLDGDKFLAGKGLEAKCEMPYSFSSDRVIADGVFRFQLARDPQFEESVAIGESPKPSYFLPPEKVPSGSYYLRCQWQRKGVVTQWTQAIYLHVQ